jgi:sugar transferase (PEP-CTERM/EpsH1 system associated)
MSRVMKGLDEEIFQSRVCAMRGFDQELAVSNDTEPFVAGTTNGFQLSIFRLARIMRQYRPHIVHSRNWGAIEAVFAARLAGVPIAVHSEHGYELDMLDGMPWRKKAVRRAAFNLADAVCTVSNDLRSYHSRLTGFAQSKIDVLYNGIDTARFAPDWARRRMWREKLGFANSDFVLGSVSRMVPLKRQETLLRAAEALIASGVEIKVLLVGSGPQLPMYEEHVKNSEQLRGRVIFWGASSDVEALLNAMDIFVLPSQCEGMSNTLLEAMSTGLPVIATRVGGNPEVVEDGVSGYLFEPGDSSTLAACALRLYRDRSQYSSFAEATRSRAVTHFALESMVSRYALLYTDLLKRKRILCSERGGN